ncbi:hypothetical protein MATL_G00202270 [Megalops atlanticus]|uniref:Uncharacterized protein n=1 Tax=Megalops atlanticus TaxID=7932 RepID=A0A9D3PKC1_MEGAT|nr:hypothetical protein MATL_G00202270 [Megalops atlanticus]
MTRLWRLCIFLLLFNLGYGPQFIDKEHYLSLCEEEDPVSAPICQFFAFDIGKGERTDRWPESNTDLIHVDSIDLKVLTALHPERIQNDPEAVLEEAPSTDKNENEPARNSTSSGFLDMVQDYVDAYITRISSIFKEWQPEPTLHGLTWDAVVIIVLCESVLFFTVLWGAFHAMKEALSGQQESDHQRKIEQLEDQIQMLEHSRVALTNENWLLEEYITTIRNCEADRLSEDSDNTQHQMSDSERHDVESQIEEALKAQNTKTQEMEQEHVKTEALLKTQIALQEKQVEENWMNACISERALEAERKETANLREQLMEASVKLAQIKSPVHLPATDGIETQTTPLSKDDSEPQTSSCALDESGNTTLERKVQQLEEQIKKMELDHITLHSEKERIRNLNKIMQEKLRIMDDLCKQKDSALQERLSLEQLEQCENEIMAAGPKEEVRAFKQKMQEINEKHQQTEDALKSKVAFHKKQAQDNWINVCVSERALQLERRETASLRKRLVEVSAILEGHAAPLSEPTVSPSAKQVTHVKKGGSISRRPSRNKLDESVKATLENLEKERNEHIEKLTADACKIQKLEEKLSAQEVERAAIQKQKCYLETHVRSLQQKLDNMNELCKQKDEALQQMVVQVESERRDKDVKVKEVLKSHRLKVQSIEEESQKKECSYKAQIASQKKKSQDNWSKAFTSAQALAVERKETACLRKQLEDLSAKQEELKKSVNKPTPRYSNQQLQASQKDVAVTKSGSALDESMKSTLAAAEAERDTYKKKLLNEKRQRQQLEEQVKTLVKAKDALAAEKSQLEQQNKAIQRKLETANNQCKTKENTLQEKLAQHEREQCKKDTEIQNVVRDSKLKIKTLKVEHQKTEESYKARITHLENEVLQNMTKICILERALDAEKCEAGDLQKKLFRLKEEMAELKEQQSIKMSSDKALYESMKSTLASAEADIDCCKEELLKERRQRQQLEEQVKTLQDVQDALAAEKSQLEQQNKSIQQKLEITNNQCKTKEDALQEKLAQHEKEQCKKDTEIQNVVMDSKLKIKALEEEHQKTEESYKAMITHLENEALQNMTKICVLERAVDAEKSEASDLQRKLDSLNVEMADLKEQQSIKTSSDKALYESMKSTLASAEADIDCYKEELLKERRQQQQLEEQVKTLQDFQDVLNEENYHLECQIKDIQIDLEVMSDLCKTKEDTLQWKLAQHEREQSEKDAEMQSIIEISNLKIKALEEEHQKAEESYKARLKTIAARKEVEEAQITRKLLAEEERSQQLEDEVRKLQCDRDALSQEKSQLEHQITTIQHRLDDVNKLCMDKEKALQKKLAQHELEQRKKDSEIQNVVMICDLKIKALEEELQKIEESYKAQIINHENDTLQDKMKICALQRCVDAEKKEAADLKKRLDRVRAEMAGLKRPLSENVKTIAALEEERAKITKKLLAEEKRSQQLEDKVKKLQCGQDALSREKCQLENQITTIQHQLDDVKKQCSEKEETLQEKLAQLDKERSDREAKEKETVYQEKQAQSNLLKACALEEALATEKTEVVNLKQKLETVSTQVEVVQRPLPGPTPSCTKQDVTLFKISPPPASGKRRNRSVRLIQHHPPAVGPCISGSSCSFTHADGFPGQSSASHTLIAVHGSSPQPHSNYERTTLLGASERNSPVGSASVQEGGTSSSTSERDPTEELSLSCTSLDKHPLIAPGRSPFTAKRKSRFVLKFFKK